MERDGVFSFAQNGACHTGEGAKEERGEEQEDVRSLSDRRKEMRHLPVVERRARNRVPHESSFLREGRQFKFNLHGEVQRPGFSGNHLSEVDKVGKDLKERMVRDGFFQ